MSLKAMDFALKQILLDDKAKLILIDLAHHHNEDFGYAFPSQERMAKRQSCSIRTVQRKLDYLVDLKLIIKEKRKNKTNAYKFIFDSDTIVSCPEDRVGDKAMSCSRRQSYVVSDMTSKESYNIISKDIFKDYILAFEEFWKIYLRKDGSKQKAKDKYIKILKEKKITHQTLMDTLKQFNEKMKGTETQFIPHCVTWLNQKRWETVEEVKKEQEQEKKLFTGVTVEEFRSASRPRKKYYISQFGHQLTEYVNQGKLTLEEITYF